MMDCRENGKMPVSFRDVAAIWRQGWWAASRDTEKAVFSTEEAVNCHVSFVDQINETNDEW